MKNTYIKVYEENSSMEIEVPWDANIEDWKNIFKTILTYKQFHKDTIHELFYEEEENV